MSIFSQNRINPDRFFEDEHVIMWIHDEIFYAIYGHNIVVDEEIARKIVAERVKLSNGRTYPTLVDIRSVRNVNKSAREYFSCPEGTRLVSAGALVLKSPLQAFLANAFLKFNKVPFPTRIFANENEAFQWIQYYKNIN